MIIAEAMCGTLQLSLLRERGFVGRLPASAREWRLESEEWRSGMPGAAAMLFCLPIPVYSREKLHYFAL